MKRIALALLAAAGLATTAARADRIDIRGSINVGGPSYGAPGNYAPHAPVYAAPTRGYWREVSVPVWVPGCWVMTRDNWGRHVRVWTPGRHEYRRERVWVDGYAGRDNYRRDHRDYRGNGPRWNG